MFNASKWSRFDWTYDGSGVAWFCQAAYDAADEAAAIREARPGDTVVVVGIGGIGINGHIAFNEPPEHLLSPSLSSTQSGGEGARRAGEEAPMSAEQFAALPTRVLSLARETRTINSVTVGGGVEVVPRRCVTVGMKEILASRKLRFYCNRPWQSAVVRRVLHGPITPACPASLLRLHRDAVLTVADYVAQPPEIRLR